MKKIFLAAIIAASAAMALTGCPSTTADTANSSSGAAK
jgi:hypothetical protein